MKKVQVDFNQLRYEQQLESLNNNIVKIENCQNALEKIVGSRDLISLQSVEDFITNKTTFANVLLSATLLEVGSEYEFLQANLESLNLDFIDFNNNIPTIKDSALQSIKESNTTYLKDELLSDYELMVKATLLLNQVSNPNYINSVKADYLGKYKVNLLMLNNVNAR